MKGDDQAIIQADGEGPLEPLPPAWEGQHCGNCGAPLQGPICHDCGQSATTPLRHFSALGEDALDAFFNFDSRVLLTLPALFLRPGFLTREYFSGRRVRYLPPFRATFLLMVLAFLAIQLNIDAGKININAGNDSGFEDAKTPAEVHKQLDQALAGLDSAEAMLAPDARAGVQAARRSMKDQANRRLRELGGKTADAGAPDRPALALWPTRIAAATSQEELRQLTSRATSELDAAAARDSSDPAQARELDSLRQQIYSTAGERMAVLEHGGADAERGQGTIEGLDFLDQGMRTRLVENAKLMSYDTQARKRFVAAVFNVLPPTLLLMLPLFALLLKIMYLFSKRLYIEHVIVALHSHAFIFLSLLMISLLLLAQNHLAPIAGWTTSPLRWLMIGLWAWIPIHLLVMQKKVYNQGWVLTTCKYLFIGFCYSMMIGLALAAAVMVTLGSM